MNEKQKKMVDELIRLTEKGEQDWATTVDKLMFETVIGTYKATISSILPEDSLILLPGTRTVELNFKEKGDKIFDSIYSTSFTGDQYNRLMELFNLSKRNALGIDDKYDEMLSLLKEK